MLPASDSAGPPTLGGMLTRDVRLLFATRCIRLLAYGAVSVILALYLAQLGLSDVEIGLLLSLTLVGDTAISFWLTTHADRMGRRKILLVGATLMIVAGLAFVLTHNFLLLLIAATVGVISPSGNEVGPFLSVEQAALSQVIPAKQRTSVFAWYSLVGSFATALGALGGGVAVQTLKTIASEATSYHTVFIGYAAFGLLLAALFLQLSSAVEASSAEATKATGGLGLGKSRRVVFRLSSLFALDAFGGGFVVQSMMAYWFHVRFGADPAVLGGIFFGANLFAGISALLAARIAARIGLVNTMVFTHLPSNVLLILVPLMPSVTLAMLVLFLRFSISQMDVPTRQSYTLAVVGPEERSAAAGITGVARTTGAAISPLLAGFLLGTPGLLNVPFFLAGGLKIVYDLLLYRSFVALKPPEESQPISAETKSDSAPPR